VTFCDAVSAQAILGHASFERRKGGRFFMESSVQSPNEFNRWRGRPLRQCINHPLPPPPLTLAKEQAAYHSSIIRCLNHFLLQVFLIHDSYIKESATKFVCGTEDGDIVFGDWTFKQSAGH
jgi:hypothetical protein